jgi:hypothetical protein
MNSEDIEAGTRPEVTEAREARRLELRDYAREQLTDPQSKAQALVNIVGKAIELTAGDPRMFENRADMVMNDLLAVIVGDGFGEEERGTGRHYVGTDNQGGDEPFFGDDGFKPEFRDARGNAGFQVHHAVAGLATGKACARDMRPGLARFGQAMRCRTKPRLRLCSQAEATARPGPDRSCRLARKSDRELTERTTPS